MKKKFLILIEDDWEVMGNGSGNVADLQYLSALAMMNILDKYKATMTFMVEVAHQLELRANAHIPEVRVQSRLWDETVLLMKERGFDVQLHLHPQWLNARYQNGHFLLSDNWNIGRCDPADQHRLISESVQYLESLLKGKFPDYRVCAFKAGSWGLQPAANLMKEFQQAGVNIIMGVREGLKVAGQGTDYSNLEEKHLPYYPNPEDITQVAGAPRDLVVIPLQAYSPDLLTFGRYVLNQVKTKYLYKNNMPYYHSGGIPREVRELQPLKDKETLNLALRPYTTHLKIGNQPFSYLKASFDAVINRLDRYDVERIPVVIESHTKQYQHHYGDIERFIAYIAEKYEDKAEFGDLTGFSNELQENPQLVRSKNVN